MDEIRFLLLHRFPAEVHDGFETQGFMILLPTMSDQDGVRVRERNELELCSRYVSWFWVNRVKDDGEDGRSGVLTRDRSELVRLENVPRDSLLVGTSLPFHISKTTYQDRRTNSARPTHVPRPALLFVCKELA